MLLKEGVNVGYEVFVSAEGARYDVGDRDGPCDGNTTGDGLKGDDEGAMVGY